MKKKLKIETSKNLNSADLNTKAGNKKQNLYTYKSIQAYTIDSKEKSEIKTCYHALRSRFHGIQNPIRRDLLDLYRQFRN